MAVQLTGWEDTIVALATAPGVGAIAVIRLSGAESFEIINSLFPSKDIAAQTSHTLHVGLLKDGDIVLDEVVISLFKSPKSYTGEDTVEISCHGSPFIQQQIIDACIRKGARLAKPGEFTQRAFLNGKMDLTQAEAVADVIASQNFAAKETALKQLRGGFSGDLSRLRDKLVEFAALIELELDFSQEDVEFADRKQFNLLIAELKKQTDALIESFRLGNAIKNGVSVAIIGKPNAGKSTLLNALLNEDRAIVSDIAGTTRDTIEETLNINGIIFRIIDTAGIREHTTDTIEKIGVGKSLSKMRSADVVIGLFDAADTTPEELRQQQLQFERDKLKYLLVANKIDRIGESSFREKISGIGVQVICISAKEKQHIDVLKETLFRNAISGDILSEGTIVTNARHHAALREVQRSLNDIQLGMTNNLPGDLIALDIRRCLHYLGEITGQVEIDRDILGTIFGKFCIGK
ncbi:MAG: tRNA uridine-5-carboxymethylaminomethyl(34) synthesis GTPase MnmE [Bacteroidetes bacterium]|nr:tRNA uridine-5-carboxymethylaminomethyl(34) synthesis GTPase MnmE [Bacteroidota bacterium]